MTSYGEAGVDLDGAARHVSRIASHVTSTWSDGVVGWFGGFAAGVTIPPGYREPVLMMTTDGVGTKLELARRSGIWEGVGFDLVAMCVDDLAASGARPIAFVDYMAVESLDPLRDEAIVASIARACSQTGTVLLGGETAEHPGTMPEGAVDLAGAALGIAERSALIGPDRVEAGDLIIGLRSPNLRSNGFSLVRKVFGDRIDDHLPRLIEPSVLYSPMVTPVVEQGLVKAAAHITGGGIAENLARALPEGLGATIELDSWTVPEVFGLVAEHGVIVEDMYSTFNMGIGFCLIASPLDAETVRSALGQHKPSVIGLVHDGAGVSLV